MAATADALPGEIWKPIEGFDGAYLISSEGRVRSTLRNGRLLRPCTDHKGYMRVSLRGQTRKVHRLVLSAFDRLPLPGEEGAHLDGDATNNRCSNLQWKTSAENKADQKRHGTALIGERHLHAKLTDDDVRRIRVLRNQGLMWKEIHREYPQVSRHGLTQAGVGTTFRHITDVPPSQRSSRWVRVHSDRGAPAAG